MVSFVGIALIVMLVGNIFSELLSVVIFGMIRVGIGIQTKGIRSKKHKSVQEKRMLETKRKIGWAFFMSVVRIVTPIVIIVQLFRNEVRELYVVTMIFFIVLELLTYKNLNFKLSLTPQPAINYQYLIIIFISIIGYFR